VLTILAVNVMVIAAVVVIHYEFLYRFTVFMPHLKVRHRFRIVFGVLGALAAHALEVWVFALLYFWMHHAPGWGHFEGNFQGTLLDCAYFSFTTYTTLGIGDVTPHGEMRYLVGLEALTGFVLITWTASFLYLEMTRYWDRD
jgi:Ion channel